MNTIADIDTHGALASYINTDDIAALYRSGENYNERVREAILTGERGTFRSDADAELFIMNRTADIIAKAKNFNSRIVAEKFSRRQTGKGVAIAMTPRGRFAVMTFAEFTNDGRAYEKATLVETEAEARDLANAKWVANGF